MDSLKVLGPAWTTSTGATKVGVLFEQPVKTTGAYLRSEAPTGDVAGLDCVLSALAID